MTKTKRQPQTSKFKELAREQGCNKDEKLKKVVKLKEKPQK